MTFSTLETLQRKAAKSSRLPSDVVCAMIDKAYQGRQWDVLCDLADLSSRAHAVETALFEKVESEPAATFRNNSHAIDMLGLLAERPNLTPKQAEILVSKALGTWLVTRANSVRSSELLHAIFHSLGKDDCLGFAKATSGNRYTPVGLVVEMLPLLTPDAKISLLRGHLSTVSGDNAKLEAHLKELFNQSDNKLEAAQLLTKSAWSGWPAATLLKTVDEALGLSDNSFWDDSMSEETLQSHVELVNSLLDVITLEAKPCGWWEVLDIVDKIEHAAKNCKAIRHSPLGARLEQGFLTRRFIQTLEDDLSQLELGDSTGFLFDRMHEVKTSARDANSETRFYEAIQKVWDHTQPEDQNTVKQLTKGDSSIIEFLLQNEIEAAKTGLLLLESCESHTLRDIKADASLVVAWLEQQHHQLAASKDEGNWHLVKQIDAVLFDLCKDITVNDAALDAFEQLSAGRLAGWIDTTSNPEIAAAWFKTLTAAMERRCGQNWEETWWVLDKMLTVWADGSIGQLIGLAQQVVGIKA